MSLTFYEKSFENNYEELITYYPAFYQRVYEMQEILKAQGKLADGVEAGIEQAYLNNFIDYADKETIGNLETFLKLDHNRTKELEMRRRIVKAHFIGNGKMSATLIKSIIQAYTDAEIGIKFTHGDSEKSNWLLIDLKSDMDKTVYTQDMLALLSRKIPAHIKWLLGIHYHTKITSTEKANAPYVSMKCIFLENENAHATSATVTCAVAGTEEKIETFLIQRKSLWYFDGEYKLDGVKLLNAEVTEEEI